LLARRPHPRQTSGSPGHTAAKCGHPPQPLTSTATRRPPRRKTNSPGFPPGTKPLYASIWNKNNLITPDGDQRLIGGIIQGRQITAADAAQLPHDKMVDTSFVKTARCVT
jgi:hypothetical protein